MVLIDEDKGVLTASENLTQIPYYKIKKEVNPVKIADVLKIHDYNYLMKVINTSEAL